MDQLVLSSNDLTHFAEQGFVRVADALPAPFVTAVQMTIWEQLHVQYGIVRQDSTTWRPRWCGINKTIIDSKVGVEITPRLVAAIDQLLGIAQWRPLKTLGGLLLTMPQPEGTPWQPALDWHFDNDPRAYRALVDELMLFTFFSAVQPQGGGTLVLSGSSRLVERYLAAHILDKPPQTADLATWYPGLAEIMGRRQREACSIATLMEEPIEVDDIPLQMIELTGEPGDAVLCHPSLMHTVSMNCSTVPRIMRRTNVRRKR